MTARETIKEAEAIWRRLYLLQQGGSAFIDVDEDDALCHACNALSTIVRDAKPIAWDEEREAEEVTK